MNINIYHQTENTSFSVFSTYYYDQSSPYGTALHFHKNYEIINVIEGTCDIVYKGTAFTLKKGEAIFIEPFITHGVKMKGNTVIRSAVFHKLLVYTLSNYLESNHPVSPIFKPSEHIMQYYNTELYRTFGTEPSVTEKLEAATNLLVKGCLYSVTGEFLRCAELVPREKNTDSIIQEMIEYISHNYLADISLRDLSNAMGYSYHYLSRSFNSTLGINFKQLLNRYRMEYAFALLEDTRIPIGEIAYQSGFQNIRTFNDNCKLMYGKTPREIRLSAQKISE